MVPAVSMSFARSPRVWLKWLPFGSVPSCVVWWEWSILPPGFVYDSRVRTIARASSVSRRDRCRWLMPRTKTQSNRPTKEGISISASPSV